MTRRILSLFALLGLASCVSPDEQFHNSTAANTAKLETQKSHLFSAAYGRGVIPLVLEIDGKTTDGNFLRVMPPYLLAPGKHAILCNLLGSWETSAALEFEFDFKAKNSYTIRGRTTGGVFTSELVNTTGGREVVEQKFKTVGNYHGSSTIFVPVVVKS